MRLDVSVNYFVAWKVLYSLQQLVHDQFYLSFREDLFVYVFLEVTAGYVLHYDVEVALTFDYFLHLNNMFMWSRTADLDFIPESAFIVFRKRRPINLFHRNCFSRQFVFALINSREMALPDFLDYLILILKFVILSLFVELDGPLLDRFLAFVMEDLERCWAIRLVADCEPPEVVPGLIINLNPETHKR